MNISLEQIDLLRKRANVSYNEAKEALENCNNNLVEALIYLEKEEKIKPEKKHGEGNFANGIKNIIDKGNKTRFVIKKNKHYILNISSILAALLIAFTIPVSLLILLVALITGHKIRFERVGEAFMVNKVLDKVSETVDNIKNDFNSNTTDDKIKKQEL